MTATERPAPAVRPDVERVADTVLSLVRAFKRARARVLAAAEQDVERSAHVLLRALAIEGPMRSGELAEAVQSDPSTVSRQVAALVRDGLLERRAVPDDGRASLLILTPRADAFLAEQDRARHRHFDELLQDWSEHDLRTFASLLDRFTQDFDSANSGWVAPRRDAPEPIERIS